EGKKGPKHGRCRTLEWQRKGRSYLFFQACSDILTGDNSLQLFLGWEGVGLASYLLIHFWFTRLQADKAATKAMPVNRVGDFGLAPGISGRFTLFQTVDFSTIFARASAPRNSWISCNMRLNAITLICILLLIGAVGKSAQIGSHTWSPDAMEGPTPVSALIHAATMVTAGVFMIARCSPLFEYPPTALIVITSAGATTSFLAATTGILQNDLKRVIAYSTCSQLGYMIFACGISNYSVSVFHLMNHAFFKALLFLSAGSVIHAISDKKDSLGFIWLSPIMERINSIRLYEHTIRSYKNPYLLLLEWNAKVFRFVTFTKIAYSRTSVPSLVKPVIPSKIQAGDSLASSSRGSLFETVEEAFARQYTSTYGIGTANATSVSEGS
ncbi:NADH-ubiquinone oxidoreductase chain 5-like, partial [Gastrolobium bilobum]|uniref:NADH-ubiquinone oxidoreductase chain 5-like n=1 Tax=Gastrolobium bilobum TaxID=150636 RepID=UPI002AAFA1C9